jgi:peptidoglycan/xylan/chitin deacetylase (PgdA/CDA1 family)
MFHDVPPEAIECFNANLRFLKQNTNVVSLDDFFSGRLSSKKINVVITFDDGYKSWVTNAAPILKALELPAIFFVSSGFIGLSKEDESDFMRSKLLLKLSPQSITGGLSAEDVRNLVEQGFTVGGHSLNHYNLAELRDSDRLIYEIAEDKMKLERITGRKVEYFAYPFGIHQNPEIKLTEVLYKNGYRGAVTTVSGFNSVSADPYLLHREITYAAMPGWVFRARTYGNYDAVRFLKQMFN